MTAAIIYAAKSTADPKGSIPTQLEDCQKMADRESWRVADTFTDENKSGYHGNRGDGLADAKALAATVAKAEGEAVLVAQHSDRFARGAGDSPDAAEHLSELFFWANRNGVSLRTVQDDFFVDPRIGPLMAAMMGQRNTEDSRRKGEAVRAGMKRHAERGLHSGPRPYGYDCGRAGDGVIVPVPAEATIVKRIYTEFVGGVPMTGISRKLTTEQVPTHKGGKLWKQSTVSGILKNPVYIGMVRYAGEHVPGVHDPIIDTETFEKAQALRTARSTPRGRPRKGRHLFRGGFLRCGQCGGPIVSRTQGGYESYSCDNRYKLKICDMKTVKRAVIDDAVYSYFEKVGLDVAATREQLAREHGRSVEEAQQLLAAAAERERTAEGRLKRVRRDYQDGKIDADDWAEQKPELTEELDMARRETAARTAAVEEAEAAQVIDDAEQETLQALAAIRSTIAGEVDGADGVAAVRAALSRLFDRFILHAAEGSGARYGVSQGLDGAPDRAPILQVPDFEIEVWIREAVLENYDEPFKPVLKREALDLQKTRNGSPVRYTSGPL